MPSDPDAPDKRASVCLALATTVALIVGAVLVLVSAHCSSAQLAALFSAPRAWRAVPQRVRAAVTTPRFTLRAQMTQRLKPRAREKRVAGDFEELDPLDDDDWLASSVQHFGDEFHELPQGDELVHQKLLGASALAPAPTVSPHSLHIRAERARRRV
jgi:hypothetical protein